MQESTPQSSANNHFSQHSSLHASAIAMYSASVVDKATTGCKTAFQLTAQLQILNT
jgi:hypothetical protein